MLETAHSLIRRIGHKLELDSKDIDALLKTDAEHSFTITLNNGEQFKAYRVQHSNKRGPYKGGIRFHPEVNLDEVRALATLMSLKTAALGLPLGGGKGGVAVDPRQLSAEELEELSRQYSAKLTPHIGPARDIPAPDVNTNPQIIDWMVDEYQKQTGDTTRASFTGKTLANGGSKGRDAATGYGGLIALETLLEHLGKADQPLSFAVQGYGNVGSYFSTSAQRAHPKWRLVAASDSGAGLFSAAGLEARTLEKYKASNGRFSDYKQTGVKIISNEALLATDADILVLAALGDAVTEKNMHKIRARFIVELANAPVTEAAHDYLTEQGIIILPDIIANAGGVIVSYLEWQQNLADTYWTLAKVNTKLESYMTAAVDEMYSVATTKKVSLKEAAFMIALRRLSE